jgi:hypothetical protein
MAFAVSGGKLVTGKALEIAAEFETAGEQIAALQLAVEMRKARRRLSLSETIQHLRRLEAGPAAFVVEEEGAAAGQTVSPSNRVVCLKSE